MTLTQNKRTFLLILFAFTFSFALRLVWVYQFHGYEEFTFNNQFMINTNDGYYFAEGARDILSGESQENDLSPTHTALSITTALLAKILPFSFESIILYMPAFFASLIVIPIILIGRSFNNLDVGFIAALFASIAHSYYNRTMIGYYDTDMLNIVFPVFLLWSLIWALTTKEQKYILFSAIEIIAYRWWYPQSYSLEFAFVGLILIYTVYLFIKKEDIKYESTLLAFMLFAVMGLSDIIRLAIVSVLFLALKKELLERIIPYLLASAVVAFFLTGGFNPILGYLTAYIFNQSTTVSGGDITLHFYNVVNTVREAGKIPFEVFANRISGHSVTFILALGGYAWLAYKHKAMLLGLPLVGLGFLAYVGGLRFTIYAVPVLAFGIAYIIYKLSSLTNTEFKKYVFMSLLTLLALLPNIFHITGYKVPTVFMKSEVEVLDRFKNIADREDYAVGWWDYGYPIRYYADVKTLIDGGKHNGDDNFAVSYLLTQPQIPASKLARLDVEYTEAHYQLDATDPSKSRTNIANMILDYGFNDANDFLDALSSDTLALPPKTRDVYLFLPSRMLNIYPTITLFSNLDLMNGTPKAQPFLHITSTFEEDAKYLHLGRYYGKEVRLNKAAGSIELNQGAASLGVKDFTVTYYDSNENLQHTTNDIKYDGALHIIYMKNYNQFIVVDDTVYNSTYFQLFVLENYDQNLFEPAILTPHIKIYKLKI